MTTSLRTRLVPLPPSANKQQWVPIAYAGPKNADKSLISGIRACLVIETMTTLSLK
jgi:hypothetical protein